MNRSTPFKTMWNVQESPGVSISKETLTEPGQICLTIREILTRFGALPTPVSPSGGLFDNEEDALAALDLQAISQEEALDAVERLAELQRQMAPSQDEKPALSEEGLTPSPPQDKEQEPSVPPVVTDGAGQGE